MEKRKDGLYSSQVYLGKVDGKKKYKTVYGKTQREVKEKVSELKIRQGKGVDISAADEPFGVWVSRYLKKKSNDGLSYSQLYNIQYFSNLLSPLFEKPISRIEASHIQDIIVTLCGWHEEKPPLSKRTLTGVRQTAGQIFKFAIGARAIDYNPALHVTIPNAATRVIRSAILPEQIAWVNDTPHRAQRAAMLMLYAGLRRGEMLALTWADINLVNATINVNKAVVYEGNAAKISRPKTEAGTRQVDIPQNLVNFLAEEKDKDLHLYVVHTRDGRLLSKSTWSKLWSSYMKDLNVKYGHGGNGNKYNPNGLDVAIQPFTAHQLRHTFCTLLYAAGYDIVEARDQMGHKDIQTTANIYTHLDKIQGERKSKGKLTKYLCQYDVSNETENSSSYR